MSYVKLDDVTVLDGEQAFELDNGSIVAVKCTRAIEGSRIYYTATARAIESTGTSLTLPSGAAIATSLKHNDTNATRVAAVARDCLLAVLGETPEVVSWGSQYLLDVSIRQALALAAISTGAIDAATTLSSEGS